jgi:hypothetical protein
MVAILPTNILPDDVGEKTIRFSRPKTPNSFTACSWTGSNSVPTVRRQMSRMS